MIGIALAWLCGVAAADEHRVARPGDTVESLAASAGLEDRADEIRARSGLGPGEQPAVGTIVVLPLDTPEKAAVLLAVTGDVSVTPPGGTALPAKAWSPLAAGSLVCTEVSGYATIRLAADDECVDHDDITLLPETCMAIRATRSGAADRTSHVFVSKGSVSIGENALDPGEVAVETAHGISVARRGGFRVSIETGASRTEALAEGVAVLAKGIEVRLGRGQGSRVRAGEAPSDPVDLLGPGTPLRPTDGARLVVPSFEWTPDGRALGYRVELATSPDFTELVRREDVATATWEPDLLFLPFRQGGLWWRVSSFDRAGFLGFPCDPQRLAFPAGVGP